MIRYSVEIDTLKAAYYCHCRMCQKSFGNIFATWINVSKSAVRWVTEPTYFHSSKLAKRGFCSQCGTPISFEYHDSGHLDLSVGSLDKPEQIKPINHFGVESRLKAFHKPDGLPEKRTGDGSNYIAKWKKLYGEDSEPGPIFQPTE